MGWKRYAMPETDPMTPDKSQIVDLLKAYEAKITRFSNLVDDLSRRVAHLDSINGFNESIIDNVNQALVVLDESFNIVLANRTFHRVFQAGSEIKPNISLHAVIVEDRLDDTIRQSLADEEGSQGVEFTYHTAEGTERYFLIAVSKIQRSTGYGQHILVTFDDVTEWKRRQLQVMEASRLLSIGEMVAGIAHEINNPMAAVMGFAQLILRRDIDASVRRDLEQILSEAQRASTIITSLQAFARKNEPRTAPSRLANVVQKVLDFKAYELRVNNIELVVNLDHDLIVMADESQLEQVFLNLISNAEDFMIKANGSGIFTVTLERIDDVARISFADNGPGIRRENLQKVFDPFFTTKDIGQGSGLGLSICYGIMQEHGGTITAESVLGQGATFVIELPIAPEIEQMLQSRHSELGVATNPALNILVVDDEPAVREVLARALAESGYEVELAASGDEVVSNPDLAKFDIIILDMKMPGMSGAKIYSHLTAMSPDLGSRVLFVTGDTTNPATADFIASTGNTMLTKPFTLEELNVAVQLLSAGHRSE